MDLALFSALQSEPEIEVLAAIEIANGEVSVSHSVIGIWSEVPIAQLQCDHVCVGIEDVEGELLIPKGVQIVFDNFCLEMLVVAQFHNAIGI